MIRHRTQLESPVGPLGLIASDDALIAIDFDAAAGASDDRDHPLLARARRQLSEYFAGSRSVFDLPLAPEGSQWQRAVWTALGAIPFASTLSYAEIARALGRPKAARAVGAANGKNPIPIVIPCHRVIGADGSLTGYGGGIEKKRWLIAHERNPARRLGRERVSSAQRVSGSGGAERA
jgi:methylated-DNA-[protein]-cysteine S-methyltransferase